MSLDQPKLAAASVGPTLVVAVARRSAAAMQLTIVVAEKTVAGEKLED